MTDGTVPFDDEMTARHQTCLVCGAKPEVLEVAVWRVQGLAIGATTCLRCRKDAKAVQTVLERRYAHCHAHLRKEGA